MEEKRLIIECDCGCSSAFSFKYFDDIVYISFIQGIFYSWQAPVKSAVKYTMRLLGRNKLISSIILKEEEVRKIIDFLESSPCSSEEVQNDSYILLSSIDTGVDTIDESLTGQYELTLYSALSPFDVIRGKAYRTGEISLNEEEKMKLVRHFKKVLERSKKRSR